MPCVSEGRGPLDTQLLGILSGPQHCRISGASTVEYRVEVCNEGSLIAYSFDVGFYLDLDHAPTPSDAPLERSHLFDLERGECVILHQRIPTPRAQVNAWVKVDPEEIIQESREDNNVGGPVVVTLWEVKGVDLRVSTFDVKVETKASFSARSFATSAPRR